MLSEAAALSIKANTTPDGDPVFLVSPVFLVPPDPPKIVLPLSAEGVLKLVEKLSAALETGSNTDFEFEIDGGQCYGMFLDGVEGELVVFTCKGASVTLTGRQVQRFCAASPRFVAKTLRAHKDKDDDEGD